MEFVQAMPYVEFWRQGFNCAIADAAAGRRRVHIVDFGLWHKQWLQAFHQLQANYVASQSASPAYGSQRQVQIRCGSTRIVRGPAASPLLLASCCRATGSSGMGRSGERSMSAPPPGMLSRPWKALRTS